MTDHRIAELREEIANISLKSDSLDPTNQFARKQLKLHLTRLVDLRQQLMRAVEDLSQSKSRLKVIHAREH